MNKPKGSKKLYDNVLCYNVITYDDYHLLIEITKETRIGVLPILKKK